MRLQGKFDIDHNIVTSIGDAISIGRSLVVMATHVALRFHVALYFQNLPSDTTGCNTNIFTKRSFETCYSRRFDKVLLVVNSDKS